LNCHEYCGRLIPVFGKYCHPEDPDVRVVGFGDELARTGPDG
jgi:hypothetical protein